jgi:fibronectin type 3 domain-containing protein
MKKHVTYYFQCVVCLIVLLSALRLQAQTFVHPGGLHTQTDLDRMKANVAAGVHPWIDDYQKLITDPMAKNTYVAKPLANMGVSRQQADADAHAAYLNTIRWYISGDTTYAECAVRICNAWSHTVNQVPSGTDVPGLSGIPIFDFAMVGELLRVYHNWSPADFAQFKSMMINYFYPACNSFLTRSGGCIGHYWANWDACNIGAVLTIGVLCDDTAKFNQGVNYFKTGLGNGSIINAVYNVFPGNLGQWQESGRDQEHAQLGIGLLGSACQVAWNQGVDLFGYDNNRLLQGAEYVARTNLSLAVPYLSYNNCDGVNQMYLSPNGLGRIDDRPVYELIYNHYVVLQGLSAPNVTAMANLQRPEHGSTDHFGYGTLTFTLNGNASPYPASPVPPAPTGLVATAGSSEVFLDWTTPSPSTAQGYNVLRATTSGGPYTLVSSWNASTYPHFTDNTVVNGTTYYYVIAATNQAGTGPNSAEVTAKPIAATSTLPTGWVHKDIGTVGTPGSASYSAANSTYIVSASGIDVGGTSDSHGYVFTNVSGDYTITARINNAVWAGSDKVGVLMRETLNPSSTRLTVNLGGRIANFGTRSTTGGNTTWQSGNQYTVMPVWFRLQRAGNVFTAFQSPDGVTWYNIGTSTVTMATSYYVGISVCAGSTTGAVNTTTFDNVSLTGAATALPSAPANLTGSALNSSQIKLTWSSAASASGYVIRRAATAGGAYTQISPPIGDTSYVDTGLVSNTKYYYSIKSENLSGISADSATVSAQTTALTTPPAPGAFTAVAGNSRVSMAWTAPLQSPTSYNIKRSGTPGGPFSTIKSVTTTAYIDSTAVNDSLYYYSVSAVNSLGEGPATSAIPVFVGKKLTGTIVGTAGSYGNNPATTKTAAMDGNLSTFFDSPNSNGSWVGLDLGTDSSAVIKMISFAPRVNYPQRMTGGIFQAGNASDFSDAVNLYTITTQPPTGALIPIPVTSSTPYRYLRYLSPNGSNGDVAEVNFFGPVLKGRAVPAAPATATAGEHGNSVILSWAAATDAASYNVKRSLSPSGPFTTIISGDTLTHATDMAVTKGSTYYYVITAVNRVGEGPTSPIAAVTVGNKLVGTLIGTSGSYGNNPATTKAAAVDGNLATFFDAPQSSGAWVGYDFGADSSAVVSSINFAPRTGYASRMVGGTFQGANKPDFSDAVTLTTVTALPVVGSLTPQSVKDTGAYRYLRYLSPTGGSCNVAEIEFYGKLRPTQTITFAPIAQKQIGNPDFDPAASASSGLQVLYTSSDTTIASIINNKVHIVKSGTVTITATQPGNNFYLPAFAVTQPLTIVKTPQTITFNPIPVKIVLDTDFNGGAVASSGLPVSYSISDSTIAKVVGAKIHLMAVGTAILTATQQGDSSYQAAVPVSQNLTVTKAPQSISFAAIVPKLVTDSDFYARATASSGLPVNYASSDSTVATVLNGKVHIVGAGVTTITAIQPGNAVYLADTSSQQLTVNKLNQTISFSALSTTKLGDADVLPVATSSSGLPVSFSSSNSNVASIINGMIHIVGVGTSEITASQTGNATYTAATSVQRFTVSALQLQVQSVDGGNGQVINNVVKPFLKIVNQDSVSVAYQQLTMRYWFTPENYDGINTWIDYAQIGNNNVSMTYVPLAQPATGALGYIEYKFNSGNSLAPASNSGPIESRFANQNWSTMNQGDDYSYQSNTASYLPNSKITLYRNGVLIWGTEPSPATPVLSVNVSYQNQNTDTVGNTISTYLAINSTGNLPVNYSDLTVRYWFTADGTQSLNDYIDYARMGSANINGAFVQLSPVVNLADHYFELSFSPGSGTLYPLSTSGNIQYRLAKSDWSNFDEANDYSYAPKDVMKANPHITVYNKGNLIYGTEPAGAGSRAEASLPKFTNVNESPNASTLSLYPNPLIGPSFSVKLTAALSNTQINVKIRNTYGKEMQSNRIYAIGNILNVSLSGRYQPGIYFVQLNNLPSIRMLINP